MWKWKIQFDIGYLSKKVQEIEILSDNSAFGVSSEISLGIDDIMLWLAIKNGHKQIYNDVIPSWVSQ